MALYLVLLSTILAFSLTSTEQYVSSPGSSINLSLDSMKNASGHWVTEVDTRQYTKKENPQPLSVNVHQRMSNKTEQLDSVDTVHPSLHDTSMNGADQPTAASTSTSTSTTPKSCPNSGYQPYPEFSCYKAFPSRGEWKTWSEARATCTEDGGDLMLIETERERKEVFIPLYDSLSWSGFPWVGVYTPQGGNDWTTVKGQPAPITWWSPGYPVNDAVHTCAQADYTSLLVNMNYCAATRPFICEISL